MARSADTYRGARRNKVRADGQVRYWGLSLMGVYGAKGGEDAVRYVDQRTIAQLRDKERQRVRVLSTPSPSDEALRNIRAKNGVGRPPR